MEDPEEDLMEFSDDEMCYNDDCHCSASHGDSNGEVNKDIYEDGHFEFDVDDHDTDEGQEEENSEDDSIEHSLDLGEFESEESRVEIPGRGHVEIRLSRMTDPDKVQWSQSLQIHYSHGGKIIGYASGEQINRDLIRATFYDSSQFGDIYTRHLGFEVFNRFGFLKTELKEHPVRKGTGKWGDELSSGVLFVIENIAVDQAWQRNGLGTIMIKGLMARAERLTGGFDFALTIPRWLKRVEFGVETQNNPKFGARATRDRHQDIAVAFFRSLGFRRVGVSSCLGFPVDPNHKVHQISSAGDYDLEEPWADDEEEESEDGSDSGSFDFNDPNHTPCQKEFDRMCRETPIQFAVTTREDYDCVGYFNTCLDTQKIGDPVWHKLDHKNNNALHIAAGFCLPHTCKWLIDNIDKDKRLRRGRNMKGYTPLESLRAMLEDERVQSSSAVIKNCVSDQFEGHDINAVKCLYSLLELPRLPLDLALRLRYGCTCGACLEGYMSPRMKFVLLTEAKNLYDTLNSDVAGEQWRGLREEYTKYLVPSMRRILVTNKPLRQSYTNLFNHIASCLRRNEVPRKKNVLEAYADTDESLPLTQSYLARGGKVYGGLKLVFACAKSKDSMHGDGRSLDFYADEMLQLPECRNDHEFGFVAKIFGIWKVIEPATF